MLLRISRIFKRTDAHCKEQAINDTHLDNFCTSCKPDETHKHNPWAYFTAVERFHDTLMSWSNCYEIDDCENFESECV